MTVASGRAPGPGLAAAALIVACGVAVYANSFTDLFLGLDGKQSIRDNPHIRRIWPPSEALSLPLWASPVVMDETPAIAMRPTYSLTFALVHRLFGVRPQPQHAVNLAIHIAAALALFGVARQTLRRQRFHAVGSEEATWLSTAIAVLWLVHPLQTESVTYIAQRAESLMGLLFLVAIYCSIRALDGPKRRGWEAAGVAACFLATGSKQTALVTPLLVLVYDHTFAPDRRRRTGFYVAMAIPSWSLLVIAAAKVPQHFDPGRYLAYALAQPGVILHYLWLTIWPRDLYLYVNTHLFDVRSPFEAIAPAALLAVAFAATAWAVWRRHWLGFVGAAFFLTLGPNSSVIAIADVIQEHRMYLPLAPLVALAVLGGDKLVGLAFARRRSHVAAGSALVIAAAVALGARSHLRNRDYHREFGPIHSADLHEDFRILADHFQSDPRILQAEADRARQALSTAAADRRGATFAHFVLGLASKERGDRVQAAGELAAALRLDPEFAYGHHHLGMLLRDRGDLDGAMEHFEEAIRLDPTFVYTHKELALALRRAGQPGRAAELLEQAVAIEPSFGEADFELGIMALERDDPPTATMLFERALRGRPDLAEAHYELGMLALKTGDLEQAHRRFDATVRIRPGFDQAWFELGNLWRAQENLERAAECLQRAVDLRPESAEFKTELGWVRLDQGEHRAALDLFRGALAIEPTLKAALEGVAESEEQMRNPS